MCILSYLRPGVAVDEDALLNGGLSNPDGHGWAITDKANGRIVVGKSMDLVEALDGFLAARDELPQGHALFHSRWATHGVLDTSNVHPFFAGHSAQTVVAHNGILPSEAHPRKGDTRSDTRLFAEELLSTRYRRLNRDRVQQALANWITRANKLVILTVDPRYTQNAYLINSGQGVWDKPSGIWHSNYDFETAPKWLGKWNSGVTANGYTNGYWTAPKTYTAPVRAAETTLALREKAKAKATAAYDYDDGTCVYCTEHVNGVNICTGCSTCQDCLQPEDECLCFSRLVARDVQELEAEREYDEWRASEGMPALPAARSTWGGDWEDDMPIVST